MHLASVMLASQGIAQGVGGVGGVGGGGGGTTMNESEGTVMTVNATVNVTVNASVVNFTDPFPDVLPQLSSIAASLLSLSRFDARFILWTVRVKEGRKRHITILVMLMTRAFSYGPYVKNEENL